MTTCSTLVWHVTCSKARFERAHHRKQKPMRGKGALTMTLQRRIAIGTLSLSLALALGACGNVTTSPNDTSTGGDTNNAATTPGTRPGTGILQTTETSGGDMASGALDSTATTTSTTTTESGADATTTSTSTAP